MVVSGQLDIQPHYPEEKVPVCMDTRLDGPQNKSRRGGEDKKNSTGNRTPVVQPVA